MPRPDTRQLLARALSTRRGASEQPQSFRLQSSTLLGLDILAASNGLSQGMYIALVLEQHVKDHFSELENLPEAQEAA